MKKLFVICLFLSSIVMADEEVLKVVYNLTTGNISEFKQKILKGIAINKAHYESNLKELEVAVVIHGDAYKFFLKDIKGTPFIDDNEFAQEFLELKKRIKSLYETYDVDFSVCGVGLDHRKISRSNVVKFVKVIPNASIGLIDKQNEGFAYLNVAD